MRAIRYFDRNKIRDFHSLGFILFGLIYLFLSNALVHGADQIRIDAIEAGGFDPVDTIYAGSDYELRLWFENDSFLGGISHGFTLRSPDPLIWTLISQNNGHGDHAAVTIIPGCRMDPSTSIWDFGFLVNERDADGVSPDTFLLGGVAITGGMAAGLAEPMISLHLTVDGPTGDEVFMLCIDSCFVPPYGDFIYSFPDGSGIVPGVSWPSGGVCWPVRQFPNNCPLWDAGLPDTLTVNHCESGQISLSATDPEGDSIVFALGALSGGLGDAIVTDHGDGTMTLKYNPNPLDVGASIAITVNVADTFHAIDRCGPYDVHVNVIDDTPQIDCGIPVYDVNEGYDVVKTDIRGIDADTCDALTYFLVSGTGNIDPVSGIYSWPSATGLGQWPITIGITDAYDTALCDFVVEVHEAVPDTCAEDQQIPGDVNDDGIISGLDISFLINYLYRAGAEPPVMANADPNGDCFIDEADVEYLADAIYSSGPPPVECTCVNPITCDCFIADANGDGSHSIADASYVINFVFKGGLAPVPYPLCSGDANSDCQISVGDAVHMINYIFKGGPRPSYCREWIDETTGCGWIVRK